VRAYLRARVRACNRDVVNKTLLQGFVFGVKICYRATSVFEIIEKWGLFRSVCCYQRKTVTKFCITCTGNRCMHWSDPDNKHGLFFMAISFQVFTGG